MENIVKYLPDFMQKYTELKELTRIESAQLSTVENDLTDVLKCNFADDLNTIRNEKVQLCAIKHLERVLKIKSYGSIQERIDRILAKWRDNGVYTKNTLPDMLRAILGNNFYIDTNKTINALSTNDYGQTGYEIYISICPTNLWQEIEVTKLLNSILPANITVTLNTFTIAAELTGRGNVIVEPEVKKEN